MTAQQTRSFDWPILAAIGGLLALSSLGLLFAGVDAAEFQAATGVAWSQFAAEQPGAAAYLGRLHTLVAIAGGGFALFGTVLAATAYRSRQRWAWNAMWLFPLVLGGHAAVFLTYQVAFLAAYYGALAAICALTLLLSRRRFPRHV